MKKCTLLMVMLFCTFFQLSAQCPNVNRPGVHVVQSGENLYRIALRYNLTTNQLADWNNIATNTTLYACQELNITNSNTFSSSSNFSSNNNDSFQDRGVPTSFNANTPNYRKQGGNKHTIQAGETISGLAQLYGYTEERFRKINLLKPGEEISAGSVILSSDCVCDRVQTYDELGNQSFSTNNNNTGFNNSTTNNGSFQNRGGNDYDAFYDNDSPATQPNNNNRIRSGSGQTNNSNNANSNSNPNRSAPASASATYMTNEELSMLDEINLMRSNPSGYIPYIEQYKRDIQSGKSFGSSLAVCDELIAVLRQTPPLSILKPTPCIYNAAKKHGLDQKARGSTGHDGSDGSWPWDRVLRECPQMSDGNENLVGGPADVREAVILLLVDDGIPSRGHRTTLMRKDWVFGTTYKVGQVGFMPNCWVQKFGK